MIRYQDYLGYQIKLDRYTVQNSRLVYKYITSSTLVYYEKYLRTLYLASGRSRQDLLQQTARRSRRSTISQILDCSVVTDVYSSGSDERTSNNRTANGTIRTATNLAIFRIQLTTSIRDTQISLEIRIGRSCLDVRIRDDTYLKGGVVSRLGLCLLFMPIRIVQSIVIERSITAYSQRLGASLRRVALIYLSSLLRYILLVILYPYRLALDRPLILFTSSTTRSFRNYSFRTIPGGPFSTLGEI